MRIEGILLPADWDEEGQVTALILATADETELRIECRQLPNRIEKFLRQKVIVDGELAGSSLMKIDAIEICQPETLPVGGVVGGSNRIRQ